MTHQLKRQEGLRLHPYQDSLGVLTIGYGRNLDDNGITEDEAFVMLEHDIESSYEECKNTFPWFGELDLVRQDVLVNMVFNMGLSRVLGFKRMLRALAGFDFKWAASEMLDSRWARQVGKRAIDLAYQMTYGNYLRDDR